MQTAGAPYHISVFAQDVLERLDQFANLHRKSFELSGRAVPQIHEDDRLATLEFAKAVIVGEMNKQAQEAAVIEGGQ